MNVTREATAYVRRRGGTAYVWLDGAQLVHARTKPPREEIDFRDFESGRIRLRVDRKLTPPELWTLVLRHFPLPRLGVDWNS